MCHIVSVQCALDCQNGGFCVGPEECQCAEGYTGIRCEEGKRKIGLSHLPYMMVALTIDCP